jgi:predicted transcriptional regulator
MRVKKPQRETPWAESRQRNARASLRLHDDLRRALEFIASADRRTLSQSLEIMVIDHVRATLKNEFDSEGRLVKSGELEFRSGKDPRSR